MSVDLSREALEATFAELTHLLIKPARLTVEEEEADLGAGGFGEVYLATLDKSSKSRRKVAIKQLRMVEASVVSRRIAFRLARELKVWAKVKHPNILELIGYYVSENYVCAQFVSAFMVNGNVMQYMKRGQVSAAIRLKFVRDITSGLKYLHEFDPPICHGDLKPANVLVNESLDAVLCDFGVSSFSHESGAASGLTTSKSIKGSLRYMSPELLLHEDPKHTLESDVWAWGCTAFEVMTESAPYSTKTNQALIMMDICNKSAPGSMDALDTVTLDSDVDPACQTGVSSLQSIIPQCWDFEPEQRPPASRIFQSIAVHSKVEARFGASEEREGGIASLQIGSDHGHGASHSAVTPYVAHSLCMNCHKNPKVGGQDFCSKACLDNASSSLPASAQNNAPSYRFAAPKFAEPDSSVSAPNARSTIPTLISAPRPVMPQRSSGISKPPVSSPQSTKMSSSYSSQQSYGSGVPPPRPSRADISNLDDIVSSSDPSNRRLSSPQAAADWDILPSLDPGDSPPPSAIDSHVVRRPGRSIQGKHKKGMLSFMSDILTSTKRPEISTPFDPVHLTHAGFNSSTGEYTGISKEWQQILKENGISRQDQEKNPQAVVEIFKFYQETAGAPGKIADKYMATSPTTNGQYDLGEGFQNPRSALLRPPPMRKVPSDAVPAPSGGTSTPQPYGPAPSAPQPFNTSESAVDLPLSVKPQRWDARGRAVLDNQPDFGDGSQDHSDIEDQDWSRRPPPAGAKMPAVVQAGAQAQQYGGSVPSAATVTIGRSASTRSPVPPYQPTRQPSGSETDGSDCESTKALFGWSPTKITIDPVAAAKAQARAAAQSRSSTAKRSQLAPTAYVRPEPAARAKFGHRLRSPEADDDFSSSLRSSARQVVSTSPASGSRRAAAASTDDTITSEGSRKPAWNSKTSSPSAPAGVRRVRDQSVGSTSSAAAARLKAASPAPAEDDGVVWIEP